MFKKEMAKLIFENKKHATRRLPSKKKYKVGSIQPIQTNYFEKAKGHIRILKTYEQRLMDMTDKDAVEEGFDNIDVYFSYLVMINLKKFQVMGITSTFSPEFLNLKPTVYEFELVTAFRNS